MTAQYEFRKMIAQVCIMGGVLVVICIFECCREIIIWHGFLWAIRTWE